MRKFHNNLFRAGMLVAALSLTAACSSGGSDGAAAGPTAPEGWELSGNADDGKAVYEMHCASCHGAEGKGDGPAGMALNPKPSDFSSAQLTDYRVYAIAKDGGTVAGLSPTMAAFGATIGDQELRDVAAYVLSLR